MRMDGPGKNMGGEDEANYALAWFAHFLVHLEKAMVRRFGGLLQDLAAWVKKECVQGYEPVAEAHHGTEPFLLFLPHYLGLFPNDPTATAPAHRRCVSHRQLEHRSTRLVRLYAGLFSVL
jgi:hypothetical protein